MTTKRIADAAICGMVVLSLAGAPGCGLFGEDVCFLDSPDSYYRLSPNGSAVSLVNANAFSHLLNGGEHVGEPLDCRFDCLVREFSRLFDNTPDSLVIVLDCEEYFETRVRLALERGYDYFEDDIPISVYYEIFQDAHHCDPRVGSRHRTFRTFESGLGFTWPNPFPPGASSLWGYSFLMSRANLDSGAFLHEFAHHWGAHLDGPPVLSNQIELSDHHWGYSSVGGQLGGWIPGSLVADENGIYQAHVSQVAPWGRSTTAIAYAPLELYLMGLVGPEEVPPVEVVVGCDYLYDAGPTDTVEFPASATQTITIDAIIEANGPRLPSVEDSPKHFKLALVVLTDHELTDTEWDDYGRAMDFMSAPEERFLDEAFPKEQYPARHIVWEYFTGVDVDTGAHLPYLNFYQATGGRATIEFVELVPK